MSERPVWLFVVGILSGAVLTGFSMQLLFVQRVTTLEVSLQNNTADHVRFLQQITRRLDSYDLELRALWDRQGVPLP